VAEKILPYRRNSRMIHTEVLDKVSFTLSEQR